MKNTFKKFTITMLVMFMLIPAMGVSASVKPTTVPKNETNYERTIRLFNQLIDDERMIEDYYGDIELLYSHRHSNQMTKVQFNEIVNLGRTLTKGVTADYQKAKIIHEWFVKNFKGDTWFDEKYEYYTAIVIKENTDPKTGELQADANADVMSRRVSQLVHADAGDRYNDYISFKNRIGICGNYANLFQIMAVAAGVPTEYVRGNNDNHAWNIFWYDKEQRWVTYDGTRKEFDISIEEFTKVYELNDDGLHYITSYVDEPNSNYYNSSADHTDYLKMYKGEKFNYNLSTATYKPGTKVVGQWNTINKETGFEPLMVDGEMYAKLRYLAWTNAWEGVSMSIGYDGKTNSIIINTKEESTWAPSATSRHGQPNGNVTVSAIYQKIYVDGQLVNIPAFTVNGDTYIKVSDFGIIAKVYTRVEGGMLFFTPYAK